jgi:hypothetical protein
MVSAAHALGYALAQSKYSLQRCAMREGVLDTEEIR